MQIDFPEKFPVEPFTLTVLVHDRSNLYEKTRFNGLKLREDGTAIVGDLKYWSPDFTLSQ